LGNSAIPTAHNQYFKQAKLRTEHAQRSATVQMFVLQTGTLWFNQLHVEHIALILADENIQLTLAIKPRVLLSKYICELASHAQCLPPTRS
jgi:hypothetical protein